MNDIDLQDKVRGLDIRNDLDQMIAKLGEIPVGLPLVWLYVWDVITTEYASMSLDDPSETIANPGYSIDDVWNELWTNPVFSLEYGPEDLNEHVRDWLMDKQFIISSEVDGDGENVIESSGEETT